jgi:hypothetical protein
MSPDRWLFCFIIGVGILTTYLMVTAPELTPEERKEMEEDWWS